MIKVPSIAIVGGGLAGLAVAAALAKFGFAAEVFEAAPHLAEIGAGVNVSPQAIRVLRAIGLGEAVAAVANVAPGVLTRDMHSGTALDYRDHANMEARFGAPLCTFHRADLLEALARGVDRGRIHLGHRLTALEEGAEDRLQLRVPVLGRLFHGRPEAVAVVHRVGAEAPQSLVRLVRRETGAVLQQP